MLRKSRVEFEGALEGPSMPIRSDFPHKHLMSPSQYKVHSTKKTLAGQGVT
jgi:hypothetical protein